MAVRILSGAVSDLCLGKPPLKSVPISATVSEALSALKRSGDTAVSVWSCDHSPSEFVTSDLRCQCVGKICMVDVICFLCRLENVLKPFDALQSPVSDLIPPSPCLIRHLEPNSRLSEAIDYILEGAQNLVIPIQEGYSRSNSLKKQSNKPSSFDHNTTIHNGQEFCWLTQEDVVRYLLNSIGVFSPIPTFTIESLNMINTDCLTVRYNEPANSAVDSIARSLLDQSCVAVIDEDNRLAGEISPLALAACNETVAAAITTLSAGDLMAYIDYAGPPDDLVHLVKRRLLERHLTGMLDLMEENSLSLSSSSSSSCSSDDEFGSGKVGRSGSGRNSGRRTEAVMCHPWNSLMAVMIQMIAHRVNYAWVVQEDYTLVGSVAFVEILKQFRGFAGSSDRRKLEGESKVIQ